MDLVIAVVVTGVVTAVAVALYYQGQITRWSQQTSQTLNEIMASGDFSQRLESDGSHYEGCEARINELLQTKQQVIQEIREIVQGVPT